MKNKLGGQIMKEFIGLRVKVKNISMMKIKMQKRQ